MRDFTRRQPQRIARTVLTPSVRAKPARETVGCPMQAGANEEILATLTRSTIFC